ncbi:MAG: fumarylacetoacetate hydrolase family protein [Saccharolobus sp.]|uniref:5-carboxymethyl-2-oxo-hex-3-ene-1,7-dioate decarboxylase n=3 Tax=Saccharolobus TaxID=2100760 RepID=A0A8F5BM62_SACSH|nr:fumarylacetoacetate hydrolase family protein [Saccharolobus shibatae]MCH4815708.1 fumarylacetoacetate hydrolase family protein [Saccharolobus shibatae]QXJ27859.1 5-carboxymethyl-2-oxo-hex-3- ene-1,7-dioate decarboxylase [Saccharolobus shibatae B12]QXJ34189.1 5-carboxymethyl-2-oxo-hex-3- ene-1,7-dioate decarboxylase [Saccharolobus shibatae]
MVKIVLFSPTPNDFKRVGVYENGKIIDLVKAYELLYDAKPPNWFYDTKGLIEGGDGAMLMIKTVLDTLRGSEDKVSYDPEKIFYYPPITNPEKIFLLAVNYKAHGKETNNEPPKEPYIFTKFSNALIGHNQPILYPKASNKVDYEVELAVIIGKKGKYIRKERASDYVFGYTVFNDISYRDKQFPSEMPYGMRWVHGKGMDTGAPMGPWIVTKDEIPNPYELRLTLRVNGEVKQDAYAEDMIFKIDEIIEYLSNGITLKPGDVISTGTPPGVGLATGKFLKPGDVIEAEISKIGVLRNYLVKEE